jgi:hypothetical protein
MSGPGEALVVSLGIEPARPTDDEIKRLLALVIPRADQRLDLDAKRLWVFRFVV